MAHNVINFKVLYINVTSQSIKLVIFLSGDLKKCVSSSPKKSFKILAVIAMNRNKLTNCCHFFTTLTLSHQTNQQRVGVI